MGRRCSGVRRLTGMVNARACCVVVVLLYGWPDSKQQGRYIFPSRYASTVQLMFMGN